MLYIVTVMAKKRLTKDEIRARLDWAKTEITRNNLSQKEAAEKVGLSVVTINKYYHEESWEKFKKNLLLTREEQMANLYDELTEINEYVKTLPEGQRFADSKLGDVRRKLVKDIKELETTASLPEIIHASQKIMEFIRKIDLTKAQEFSGFVDAYIKSQL